MTEKLFRWRTLAEKETKGDPRHARLAHARRHRLKPLYTGDDLQDIDHPRQSARRKAVPARARPRPPHPCMPGPGAAPGPSRQ